jgi:EAL domain-containing protein (putative c-di-GMP-specific phosphodiesterase class I)
MPPAEFVPLAEHTAIIQSLTNYVLDAARAPCRAWRDQGHDIVVAVNISARSLHDPTFYGVITGALERHGVPAELLELEITETSIMEDPKGARDLLVRLHDLGVQLAVDDFGTGYSSLAYLKTLPVNSLKIDMSFAMNLHEDQSDAVIVQSVIDLGRNLGMSVVAEGVERAEVIEYLTDAGCQVGQGFYWSKAVPPDELAVWLAGPVAPAPLALNAPV